MSLYKYLTDYLQRCIVCTVNTNRPRCYTGSLLAGGLSEQLQHHSLVDSVVPTWLTRSATAEACTCFTVLIELLNQANGATPEQEIESIAHFFRDRIVRDAGNNTEIA